ncbi:MULTISPECIES: ABC transporter ATP-binding protein [Haloferax]|uniref:Molybdate/tungstate import ATP-binding protein WtpC n=2 Tax=Haloferax TaxID=2251 RepID=A0A6G1Z721_9EURY|nr:MULTISPECIES: ABC transporter ATP-binding protein [Haloferax]KAB1185457.1 ABC transporter ATP-binding protein [Haloferax sp. CBA1149]MRW82104.1 ATP-binding cassette domain-containing protein [Haloferax marinisediminis]
MSNANLDDKTEPKQQATIDDRENVLKVEGLTKIYPDGTLAVDDIDFQIKAGDFCVIIGPSGCGKSTTLHSLVGKIPPTEGKVILDGKDITHAPTYERDIGLVFQDFQLFPHLTVEENIIYGLKRMDLPKDVIDERLENVLEMMQLHELRARPPKELSSGQKQRVALARSLVLEPKLLLLDEPLGDMDYKLQKRMERELLRIHRELDTTFVYVTHDQTQAMRLADQVIVMNGGKIEHSAPVEEVYNEPNTAFVAAFVGDSNMFDGEIVGLSEDESVATVQTSFGEFTVSTANLHSPPADIVGKRMPFAVRPQFVKLGGDTDNTLECRVEDVIYQSGSGTQVILFAETDEGEEEIQLKSEDYLEVDEDRVTVGWDTENTIILERTSVVDGIDLDTDILGK